jgi:hypothetical protein
MTEQTWLARVSKACKLDLVKAKQVAQPPWWMTEPDFCLQRFPTKMNEPKKPFLYRA